MSEAIAEHFRLQADACDKMGSPFTARLCRLLMPALDRRTATGRMVLDWPGDPRADALALRFCGGLHSLVLDGSEPKLAACYPPAGEPDRLAGILPGVIGRNDARLATGLGNAPQTNEIARSAALFPGLLEVFRLTRLPLALHEIGASAGLNLMMDKFGYRFGSLSLGNESSPIQLVPEMRGGLSGPGGTIQVVSRSGCDIVPLHISNAADRLRLRSYIWPDQPMRMKRLDEAIEIAASTSFSLRADDAAVYVEQSLAGRKRDQAFVLFHSVMWQYLPEETKLLIEAALGKAGNAATHDAPVAWLRMEGLGGVEPYATLSLTLWPGGESRHLARCDWHCRWIEWLEPGGG